MTDFHQNRLEQLFQYALAVAAQADDWTQRQLGPIHLIKYAYLGDLAHAERKQGETFTGTTWQFFHFGPWNQVAHDRIEASLAEAGATRLVLPSKFENDYVRFKLEAHAAQRLAERLERDLPLSVSRAIASAVKQHGTDTADLLRHVYTTAPMLHAKPRDVLDFRRAGLKTAPPTLDVSRQTAAKRSASERMRYAKVVDNARREMQRRLAAVAMKRVAANPPPRYDDVFFEGMAQLDQLAGESVTASAGEVTFDESVWTSDQRREPDVS